MTDPEIVADVARGMAEGQYFLLLGAGSSIGATGGNGIPLPTAVQLRDVLIDKFGIETDEENFSLAEVYRYLQLTKRQEAQAFLYDWFTNCTPSWQGVLAEFNFRRIWTLNVDDVVENAFKSVSRPLESLSWRERFSDRDSATDQQIIHLHGLAARLCGKDADENALVFSLSEYAHEVATPLAWHKVFHDELASKAFLIIGAQLTQEIDLIETLERGSAARESTGLPSVLVVPTISHIRRTQVESYGFVVVESRGEDFMQELLQRYRETVSNLGGVVGPSTQGLLKFQQQFINLTDFDQNTSKYADSQDFYSGYQPTWNTIKANNDVVLEKTGQVASEVSDLAVSDQVYQQIVFLTGNPGSGKSTGLLRVASNLIGLGMRPYLFRADEYMDIEATIEWLKRVPRTILFFDDFADHSTTLNGLATRCHEENVRLLLVGSDRAARIPMIRDRIDTQFLDLSKAHWYGKMSNSDVNAIIDKLYEQGRLGRITRWNRQQQRTHFIESAERSLFEAMSELEWGHGFRDRVRNLYQTLPTDELRNLYAAASLCYDQSIPIPIGIAADFAGIAPSKLAAIIEDQCRGILLLTRTGIRPPHRMTASLALRTLPRQVRAVTSLALAKSMAPHVDDRAMRSGTREYRIVRHLAHYKTVIHNAGEHEGRRWYDELRPYYDWNGRYWDQRALFESAHEQYAPARSYAERSIQVHPHAFGFNTLGTVLLHMAIYEGSAEALNEGVRNLAEAKRFRDWEEREHPFTAFFGLLIRFARKWGISEIPQQIRNSWPVWLREAQSSQFFSTPRGYDMLQNWQRQWIRLVNPSLSP